jgi:uncharacterized protein (DUF885 family)
MLDTEKTFQSLSEEFVEVFMRHYPVEATRVGLHDYDDRLPDDSPAGFRERTAWLRDFEQRLVASVPWRELPAEHRVDFALLRSRIATLRAEIEEMRTPARDPVRYAETALHGVYLLLARPFAPIEERKEHILARLMAIPDYLDAVVDNLEAVPALHLDVVAEINASGHAYVEDIVRTLSRQFPGERERIEHAGSRARVGFLQYQEALDARVRPQAVNAIGIGERWMNFRLEREHLLPMDCAALETFGREHVIAAKVALEAAAQRLDPGKSWQQQLAEAKNRHPEALRLREAYQAEVERARRFVEERRLAPMVDAPVEVVDTPRFERAVVPYATYLPPAAFDAEQTGYLYVTPIDTNRPREEQRLRLLGHNYGNLPLLVVHESYPGHHLQICHAHRHGSRLRRLIESPLLAEGWALYCEQLMDEHGFFLDPVSKLFRLADHLWRACRVVLDVNLQCGRMTVAEAVRYLEDEAQLERPVAEAEVRRYVITPTEPMSYLVGQSLLMELRTEAARRLGERFDLYRFHGELLACGTIPPTLLKDELWERLGAASETP